MTPRLIGPTLTKRTYSVAAEGSQSSPLTKDRPLSLVNHCLPFWINNIIHSNRYWNVLFFQLLNSLHSTSNAFQLALFFFPRQVLNAEKTKYTILWTSTSERDCPPLKLWMLPFHSGWLISALLAWQEITWGLYSTSDSIKCGISYGIKEFLSMQAVKLLCSQPSCLPSTVDVFCPINTPAVRPCVCCVCVMLYHKWQISNSPLFSALHGWLDFLVVLEKWPSHVIHLSNSTVDAPNCLTSFPFLTTVHDPVIV